MSDDVYWVRLRCERTGNPCNTDTTVWGDGCFCVSCRADRRIRELECQLQQAGERYAQAIEGLPDDSTPQQCAEHVRNLDKYEGVE